MLDNSFIYSSKLCICFSDKTSGTFSHSTYFGFLFLIISTLYQIRLEAVPESLSAPSSFPALLNEVHGLPCVKISKSGNILGLTVVISQSFKSSETLCITEKAVLAYLSISQYPTISCDIFNSFNADENVPLPANASYIFNFSIFNSPLF